MLRGNKTEPAILITVLITMQMIHLRAVKTLIRIKTYAFSILFMFVHPKIKCVSWLIMFNHETHFINFYMQILLKTGIFYNYTQCFHTTSIASPNEKNLYLSLTASS